MKKILITLLLLFCMGNIMAQKKCIIPFMENGKWGAKNYVGKIILPAKYDSVDFTKSNASIFKLNQKYGMVGIMGDIKLKPEYDVLWLGYKNFPIITKNGKTGVYSLAKKRFIVPMESGLIIQNSISSDWRNMIWYIIKKKNGQYLYNAKTNIYIPKKYHFVEYNQCQGLAFGVTTKANLLKDSTYLAIPEAFAKDNDDALNNLIYVYGHMQNVDSLLKYCDIEFYDSLGKKVLMKRNSLQNFLNLFSVSCSYSSYPRDYIHHSFVMDNQFYICHDRHEDYLIRFGGKVSGQTRLYNIDSFAIGYRSNIKHTLNPPDSLYHYLYTTSSLTLYTPLTPNLPYDSMLNVPGLQMQSNDWKYVYSYTYPIRSQSYFTVFVDTNKRYLSMPNYMVISNYNTSSAIIQNTQDSTYSILNREAKIVYTTPNTLANTDIPYIFQETNNGKILNYVNEDGKKY